MIPSFLKKVDDTVLFNDDGEMIYYVPEKYFNGKNAVVIGEYVDLMGVFNYDVFYSNGKNMGLKVMKYPGVFRCKPTEITRASMQLKGTIEEIEYRLLHFKKGAEAISNTKIPITVAYAENFIGLLTSGNLPTNIPYNEIQDYIIKNAKISGVKYNLSAQLFGIIISELYRDPKNLRVPFRLADTDSMIGYRPISIKMVPKYISPYTAITSENADESIAAAMNFKQSKQSPLERVIMN